MVTKYKQTIIRAKKTVFKPENTKEFYSPQKNKLLLQTSAEKSGLTEKTAQKISRHRAEEIAENCAEFFPPSLTSEAPQPEDSEITDQELRSSEAPLFTDLESS